jgi:hypothetical protein
LDSANLPVTGDDWLTGLRPRKLRPNGALALGRRAAITDPFGHQIK